MAAAVSTAEPPGLPELAQVETLGDARHWLRILHWRSVRQAAELAEVREELAAVRDDLDALREAPMRELLDQARRRGASWL